MNTLFKTWLVGEANPSLSCTEIVAELSEAGLNKLRNKAGLQNSPVLNSETVASYFSSNGIDLNDKEKEEISKHIGTNINSLNFAIQHSVDISASKYLELTNVLLLTNTKNKDDIKGIYFVSPGSCGVMSLYASKMSKSTLNRSYYKRDPGSILC